MKMRLFFFLLTIAPLQLFAMPSEKTQKDSICEFLSGTWYKVLDCNGSDGKIRPIYLGDTVEIKRMNETDSLSLTTFKNGTSNSYQKLSFSHFDYDMDAWIFNTSYGTDRLFYFEGDVLYIITEYNGYGYARKQLISSVTASKLLTDIQAFPNPTNGSLQLSEPVVGSVRILDASGRELKRLNATQPIRTVDFSTFHNGLYFLQIETKGKPTTLKIQKK